MKVTLKYVKRMVVHGTREIETDDLRGAISLASLAVSLGFTQTTDVKWEEPEYEDFSLMLVGGEEAKD